MSKRGHISLRTQLAAALLGHVDEHGKPVIPHEHAKLLTADQIISLFHRDHYPIRKDDGGPDEPWNLVFRFIPAHREKTAKIDQPQIAKRDRIIRKEAAHKASIADKILTEAAKYRAQADRQIASCFRERPPKRSRWPQGRKLRSRGFQGSKRS